MAATGATAERDWARDLSREKQSVRIRLYSPGSGSAFLNCQTSSPCSNASTIRESTSDDREDEVLSWKKESSSSGIRRSAPIFLAMSRQRRR